MKADLNGADWWGYNPLHYAARAGLVTHVTAMLHANANPHTKTSSMRSALSLSLESVTTAHHAVGRLLRAAMAENAGSSVDDIDKSAAMAVMMDQSIIMDM